ncbi:hypothetical protein SprV_0802584700 [Sparganum proliferum]
MRAAVLLLLTLSFLSSKGEDVEEDTHSPGRQDNLIASFDDCTWIEAFLPQPFKMIVLDERNLSISNGYCQSSQGYNQSFPCEQEKHKSGYIAAAKICGVENYFRIGWELEDFHVEGKTTQITQFVITNQGWLRNNISCILPQYSLPLIRSSGGTEGVEVTCAIRLSLCCQIEAVVIFGLTQLFCEYNDERQTCGRKIIDNDTIIYSTTIYNEPENKYYPEQYVFCNSVGSHLSIRIIRDLDLPDIEEASSSSSTTADVMQSQTPATEIECIQPQYSLPLLRYSNGSATVDVECAIRLPMCENSEDVVIYGLKETFCEYNAERKTCGRRVVDNEVIIYSTKIEKDVNNDNNNNNKYYPDQYIFCNGAGRHMSMQIVWDLRDHDEEETSSPSSTTADMMQSQTPLTEIDLHFDDEEAPSPSSTTPDMMQSQTPEKETDLRDHDEEETSSPSSTTADMIQSQTPATEIELHNDEEEESSSSSSTPADMMQSETPTAEIGPYTSESPTEPCSNGTEDNTVTLVDNCILIQALLPEPATIEKDVNNDNNNNNKYYPDQYIFCNGAGRHMSMQIVWDLRDHDEEETSSPSSTTADMMQSQTPLTEIDLHFDDEEASSPSSTTPDMMQSQTPEKETDLRDHDEEETSSPSSTTADMIQSQTPATEIELHNDEEEESSSSSSTPADMMQSETPTAEIDLRDHDEEETSSPSSTTADMIQSQTPATEIGIGIFFLLLFTCN